MNQIYSINDPKVTKLPILLSSPHSGTLFPEELKSVFKADVISHPTDTDWFVDRLYNFASDLGIAQISANYSRYVIDLNRDYKGQSLYQDGRFVTGVVPTHTFNKMPLYQGLEPTQEEIEQRIESFYHPYYEKIEEMLSQIKKQFGFAIFFDCHSIKRSVPSISLEAFPDLILGDNDGKSADPRLSKIVLDTLGAQKVFDVYHNVPFKGGNLTRTFGRPEQGIHALQLEMSQDLYLEEKEDKFIELKAALIRSTLKETLTNLSLKAKEIL